MMVDLLAGHTSMPVSLATDGMNVERERVYVIPPGVDRLLTTRARCGFRSRRHDTARGFLSTSS